MGGVSFLSGNIYDSGGKTLSNLPVWQDCCEKYLAASAGSIHRCESWVLDLPCIGHSSGVEALMSSWREIGRGQGCQHDGPVATTMPNVTSGRGNSTIGLEQDTCNRFEV